MFRAAAVLAAVALMTFAGCTKVDDTLGSNLVPDNQQMKVGYTTLGARTLAGKLDAAKYVETRLFQSDSLKASNISYGYMGSMLSDTFGLRTAGFLTQYLNVYKVKEGYFGYRPIFDSAQILITITSYGNDTLTPQKYNVYEIKSNKYLTEKPVAAGKTERDTVFYLNFDPVKEGVIGADDEPVFTFTFPDGETTGPATTAVTMNTTPATQNFIDRLMLQKGSGTAYEDDYSIYSTDSLKQWVEEFKGLYIVPAEDQKEKGKGNIYATELESSGFMVYARNRVESDPTLIKDTIGMVYYFYESGTEFGNVSVNTITHDYTKYNPATAENVKIEIAEAREPKPDEEDKRPDNPRVYVEGMGGVVTEMTFTEEFFRQLAQIIKDENAASAKEFNTLAINQARMSVYFAGSNYDWQNLTDVKHMIEQMDASQSHLGLYTNYKKLSGITDYAYAYEKTYSTTLTYGGYINRSRGCYVMDITGYMQQLWNSYIKAKEAAGGVIGDIDWDKVANRTVYIGPDAYSLYSTSFGVLQGMAADGNEAPIRFEIFYNLIK